MKYHVLSGEVRMLVDAPSLEAAFIAVVRVVDLEKCSQFICGYEHGKKFEDLDTSWGLTEWYLERAGYKVIGDHLWRKDPATDTPSSGNSGLNQKKAEVVKTSTPLAQESISKTDSPEPSARGGKRGRQKTKSERKTSSGLEMPPTRRPIRVALQRTPEEWAAVLAEARERKGLM